jgi:alginate O-acetyltransferase complex protein AlgI
LASYFFYGYWKIEYLSLIVLSTIIDFYIAQHIASTSSANQKRLLLFLSCSVNLGILFLFKYFVLFKGQIDLMTLNIYSAEHPIRGDVLYAIFYALPVGISFYTFQTMSYTIDVYYGRIQPEKNIGKFALFVSFFPQLVAGPIERFSHLQPQLLANHPIKYANFSNGFRLLLWGFFIKICIADNVSQWVDAIYAAPQNYTQPYVWLGILGFGTQIYADFAGYSLIAQGAALLMGIKLMDNFRTPYLSSSIGEFWQRWHISLSTWFRDYVYIPLGGNKVKLPRWIFNIMVVFLLSGFWHGANWTFLIWGGIHGLLYLVEYVWNKTGITKNMSSYLTKPIGILVTFLIVHLAWIFFRIDDTQQFTVIWDNLWHGSGTQIIEIKTEIWLVLGLFILLDGILYNKRIDSFLESWPSILRWLLYALLFYCILAFGGTVNHPFIYFQF